MAATRLDTEQARNLLRNYTGDAEARAQLAAAINDQPGDASPTPSGGGGGGGAKRERSREAVSVRKARARVNRDRLRNFSSGGGVPGDYRTLLEQRKLEQQRARLERVQDFEQEESLQRREAAMRQAPLQPGLQAKQQQDSSLRRGISSTFSRVRQGADWLNSRADRVPTPGGLSSLVLALIALVFMAVPANVDAAGNPHTRAELLWLTIRGQTTLPTGQATPAPATSTSGATTSAAIGGVIPLVTGIGGGANPTPGAPNIPMPSLPQSSQVLAGPWTFGTRWEEEFG